MTYCSVADVQRVLLVKNAFSSTTNPTAEQVMEFIKDAEDEIDDQCNHSWREVRVVEEFYDLPVREWGNEYRFSELWEGVAISLRHRRIKPLSSTDGDKMEVWDGTQYVDWVTTKTEGRNNDYWMDSEQGVIYLRQWLDVFYERAQVRLTYRYGEDSVPNDIRKATALLAAIAILSSDERGAVVPDGGSSRNMNHEERVTKWQEKVDTILANHGEIKVI